MNVSKTKILIFRKGGILSRQLEFIYEGSIIEIVKHFKYLGIVFTTGGSVAPDFVHQPLLSKLNKSGWGSNHFCSYAKMDKNG